GPLALRFITEPGHAYRMVMLLDIPGCDTDMLYTISQLYFYAGEGANVAIEKSAPAESARNQMLGYTLTVRNTSPLPVTDVVVTDTLPSGLVFGDTPLTLRNPTTGERTTTTQSATSDPPPSSVSVDRRALVWNLGTLQPNETRTINLSIPVPDTAPDTVTNVAVVSSANDTNPADNRAEATTTFFSANVGVRITAPRITRPGEEFDVVLTYVNTSDRDATDVHLYYVPSDGVTVIGTSRAPDEVVEREHRWNIGTVAAGQTGTVRVSLRVVPPESPVIPAAIIHYASIDASNDADPMDNNAQATTVVLVVPPATPDEERLRIHSEFDPEHQVYRSTGGSITWPAGEILDFTPSVFLRETQVGLPYYFLRRRIVAWSFVRSGPVKATAPCKDREEPTAQDLEHADLSRMRGCVYRYMINPSPEDMRRQGHLFWSEFAPDSMRPDVYTVRPLPRNGTDLVIQYAVLTEAVETNLEDVDGDGVTGSVLERRTDILETPYRVYLVVPRDAR
ncbi:MAG: DUF11 domain-containing protein, partial [Roseiflexus sp.]